MKSTVWLVTPVIISALMIGCSCGRREVGTFEYVRKGNEYLEKKDYANGVRSFEKAYGIAPGNDSIRSHLVNGYTIYAGDLLRNEQTDRAIDVLEKAYDIGIQRPNVLKNLTSAYLHKASRAAEEKDYATALFALRKARMVSGRSRSLKERLSRMLFVSAIEAYNRDDFQTAVLYLTEAKQLKKDRRVLEFLGDIYYRRSELELAIAYWSDIGDDEEGDAAALNEKIGKARKELELDRSSESFLSGNFILEIEEGLEVDSGKFKDILEEAYQNVGEDFDYYLPKQTAVHLYSERTFRELFRQPYFVAAFFDGKIRLPVHEPGLPQRDMRRYIVHEYAHAIISAVTNNNCPRWFNEGLAVFEERSIAEIPVANLKDHFFQNEDMLTFAYLESAFMNNSQSDMGVYYLYAYSIVSFIEQQWGLVTLNAILRRLGAGRHLYNAIEDVLPFGIQTVEKRWKEHLKRTFSPA
ncbi:MAG: peptidase MA family metallohydrolase [Candidatus Omnitrophota bacterium]